MKQVKAKVTAIGTYVPYQRLTNDQLAEMIDTSDEWITTRTGIKERRIAATDEYSSDLGYKAVLDLAKRYQVDIADVDFIICATFSPDAATPSTAALIQAKLNIKQAGAIDINAACAGFTYSLHLANSLIASGLHKKILVVAAETLSKVTDYEDRTTCILFGDGAGAVLVEADSEQSSFVTYYMGTEGEKSKNLYCSSMTDQLFGEPIDSKGYIVQNGREVYRWAVSTVPKGVEQLLEQAGLLASDIDYFVPHSANVRMLESICERIGIPLERTLYSLELHGNTSAASIPLSLDMAVRQGQLMKGQKLLLYGFGGGLTHHGLIMNWTI